jgi:hypothetical protein
MPADPNRNPDAKYFHLFSVDVRLPRNEEQWMNKQGWVRPDPIRDPVHFQYAGNTNQTPAPRIKQTGFDRMAIDRIRSRLQRLGLAVKP